MKLNDTTYNSIKKYLDNKMTSDELLAFEKEITINKDLKDTIDILKKMDIVYSDEQWQLYDGDIDKLKEANTLFLEKDVDDFSKKIRASQEQFKANSSSTSISFSKYIAAIAAVFLILLGTNHFFNSKTSSSSLYNEYYSMDDLPSFTVKSSTTTKLEKAEYLFKSKKYEEALQLLNLVQNSENKFNPSLTLYLALTNAQLANYQKSLDYLDTLLQSNTLDSHKAYWFKALIYLKQNNKEKAIKTLKILTQNKENFNYNKAVSLLEELE